ncbi:DUF554 domain-containing protein [Anaerovibrio sp.]|uniref:DUF554 domain-containing protein n=1 Tax=Anaerovibrio sp. TaxID=1872532 RepID=UPI003F15F79B
MFAVIVNTLAIVAGSLIGLLLRRGLPEKLTAALMQGLGLCTVLIGVQGAVRESNILIMIVSVVLGLLIGESCDADGRVNRFAERLMSRFAKGGGEADRIANAFVTSCLIMNVGAMVIVGSLDAGLRGDYTMLYTKSLLDFISGIMMTAAMGIGVMGSAVFTLVFQGAIVLLAEFVAPFISDYIIQEMSCTGCLIILALGLNMLELTKIKVINYLPALVAVPLVAYAARALGM